MIWTNKYQLPSAIYNAITNDDYSKGEADFSVTELLSPPKARVLIKKHWGEIEKDISENIWILFGRSLHKVLEHHEKDAVSERRLTISLSVPVRGQTTLVSVSGGMDRFVTEDGTLQDYKTTSVYSVKEGGKKEWDEQLNSYAVLLRHHNIVVQKLEIIAFLRDYRPSEALRDANYPASPVVKLDVELWPENLAYEFLIDRARLHLEAEASLPECTSDEMWMSPTVFAVKRKGAKNAIAGGLFVNKKDAEDVATCGKDLSVEERRGKPNRCPRYCDASPFCDQYKKLKAGS